MTNSKSKVHQIWKLIQSCCFSQFSIKGMRIRHRRHDSFLRQGSVQRAYEFRENADGSIQASGSVRCFAFSFVINVNFNFF